MNPFLAAYALSAITLWVTACSTHTVPRADQDYALGQKLFAQQDYHAAFAKLVAAGNRGQANAQYAVGYMLYNGMGVTRDEASALLWLNRAARKGNPRAQGALEQLETTAEKQVYHLKP